MNKKFILTEQEINELFDEKEVLTALGLLYVDEYESINIDTINAMQAGTVASGQKILGFVRDNKKNGSVNNRLGFGNAAWTIVI